MVEALLKSGALASTFAQEVQAGTAHFVVAFHNQFGNAGGIGVTDKLDHAKIK